MTARYTAVYPISGEDLTALPVKDIGPAVGFYTSALGFTVVSRDDTAAVVRRDDARLGLVRKASHKPDEAGSCCFAATDLDAAREELVTRGGSEVGVFGRTSGAGGGTARSSCASTPTATVIASATRPRTRGQARGGVGRRSTRRTSPAAHLKKARSHYPLGGVRDHWHPAGSPTLRRPAADLPDTAKLDKFFDRLAEKNKAMGSLAVVKDGTVVHARTIGYGRIDRKEQDPLTAASRFRIGSITKLFTAALVLQLVDEGKLKPGDPNRPKTP